MKLLYFQRKEQLCLGVVAGKGIFDVDEYQQEWGAPVFSTQKLSDKPVSLLKQITDEAVADTKFFKDESALTIGPCIPKPSKIICIGLNYRKHAMESNMPAQPYRSCSPNTTIRW